MKQRETTRHFQDEGEVTICKQMLINILPAVTVIMMVVWTIFVGRILMTKNLCSLFLDLEFNHGIITTKYQPRLYVKCSIYKCI